MKVFLFCLVLFGTGGLTARPPNNGYKGDGWPNGKDVEPMDHLVAQVIRPTTGPPTGPQQIVRLPYIDIHMLPPRHPRFQDYPEIFGQHRDTHSKPKIVWFKETGKIPSLCRDISTARSRCTMKGPFHEPRYHVWAFFNRR